MTWHWLNLGCRSTVVQYCCLSRPQRWSITASDWTTRWLLFLAIIICSDLQTSGSSTTWLLESRRTRKWLVWMAVTCFTFLYTACVKLCEWMYWGGYICLSFKLFTQECWIDLIEIRYWTTTRKDVGSICFWFILAKYNFYLMWRSN